MNRSTGPGEPLRDAGKLRVVIDLYPKVIDAFGCAAAGDGEVHTRIFQHPLGVVRLSHGWFGAEQRRIEADGLVDVANGDGHGQALDWNLLCGHLRFRSSDRS